MSLRVRGPHVVTQKRALFKLEALGKGPLLMLAVLHGPSYRV